MALPEGCACQSLHYLKPYLVHKGRSLFPDPPPQWHVQCAVLCSDASLHLVSAQGTQDLSIRVLVDRCVGGRPHSIWMWFLCHHDRTAQGVALMLCMGVLAVLRGHYWFYVQKSPLAVLRELPLALHSGNTHGSAQGTLWDARD